jgi:hypothetical protein
VVGLNYVEESCLRTVAGLQDIGLGMYNKHCQFPSGSDLRDILFSMRATSQLYSLSKRRR